MGHPRYPPHLESLSNPVCSVLFHIVREISRAPGIRIWISFVGPLFSLPFHLPPHSHPCPQVLHKVRASFSPFQLPESEGTSYLVLSPLSLSDSRDSSRVLRILLVLWSGYLLLPKTWPGEGREEGARRGTSLKWHRAQLGQFCDRENQVVWLLPRLDQCRKHLASAFPLAFLDCTVNEDRKRTRGLSSLAAGSVPGGWTLSHLCLPAHLSPPTFCG